MATLDEEAQFLLSVQGESPRDVWQERWRAVQEARTVALIAEERTRRNPDRSLDQSVTVSAVNAGVKVGKREA